MNKTSLNQLFHCVYSLNYHLVIVTKYRKKVLTGAMLDRLEDITRERLESWEGSLTEFNGEADHLHLLFSLPPKYALSSFVNTLKTNMSRRLRKEFANELSEVYRKPVLWSQSYCVISVGGAPLDVVKKYIEQQARPR